MANGNYIILVMDKKGRLVDAKVFQRSKYSSIDVYEESIAKHIGCFERKYKDPDYVIHQGSASDVASFFTVYPELASKDGAVTRRKVALP